MSIPKLTVDQFRERLAPLIEAHPDGAVVFDADGTLWAHDVGCMVYDWAVEHEAFSEEAATHLVEFAREQGLHLGADDPVGVSRELQDAFYTGRLSNRATAVMQVWAYVGTSEEAFRKMVREALLRGQHEATLHGPVVELAAWVRSRGVRALIVSASPQWVVEEAARDLGFVATDIVAGRPNLRSVEQSNVIAAGLGEPLPYGPDKVHAGRALMGEAPWLAALGDSSFDVEMFQQASLAGGIGSKEDMLAGLSKLPHGVRILLD